MNTDPASEWQALRNQPFALLQAMERRLRAAQDEAERSEVKVWTGLAFRVGAQWWLTPREEVQEIAAPPRLTRVPGARPWLLGVANVRGSLLPITDLAGLMGAGRSAEARLQRLLVLNAEGVAAGFLVDEVDGQRLFAPADQAHELIADAGSLRPWLLGGFRRDGREWRVLSLRRVAMSDAFGHAGA